jgi:hypothetical protein
MISGFLVKMVIGFAIVAVIIFDGGSILINFFTLDSRADEIAVQVTTGVEGTPTEDTLRTEAAALAKESGAHLVDLTLEGEVVHLTLRRKAGTMVVGKIGWFKGWTRATAEGQAGT